MPCHNSARRQVVSADGKIIPSQPVTLEDGSEAVIFTSPVIPALGCSLLCLNDAPLAPSMPVAPIGKSYRLENRYLLAEVDPANGELTRLFDKINEREVLAPGKNGNRLVFYGDKSRKSNFEPWYIEYTGEIFDPGVVKSVDLIEKGPVRSRIRVTREVSLSKGFPVTRIVQEIVLYADSPILHFQMSGDWQAENVLLKAEFDLSFSCDRVVCEMPYGVAERKPNMNAAAFRITPDSAREDRISDISELIEPDRPMHKWLDFSGGKQGLAFLNNGKYGYDASSNQVRISLLRAPIHRNGEIVGLGEFFFSYAVMPHGGDWVEADLPKHGYAFNHELIPVPASRHKGLELRDRSLFGVRDSANVLITSVKLSEDGGGLILRLYESVGKRARARLISFCEIKDVTECDLIEDSISESSDLALVSDTEFEVNMKPFEIKTILLKVEPFAGIIPDMD